MSARDDFPFHLWASEAAHATLNAMWNEIDALRAEIIKYEGPERERARILAAIRTNIEAACARDVHAVTKPHPELKRHWVCTNCGKDVTDEMDWVS